MIALEPQGLYRDITPDDGEHPIEHETESASIQGV